MKKKIILSINTGDNKKVEVGLIFSGKTKSKTLTNTWSSQRLLPLIDEILVENNLKATDLTEIKVNPGPGSYTGLRVGVAVANALSYLLRIPVNGRKNKLVIPRY